MIGIIGAVVEEAEAIKKEIKNIKENVINGISFFIGKFNNKDVVFVQSGIGKVNATITATLLIEKFDVKEYNFPERYAKDWKIPSRYVYIYMYEDEPIWGITAEIIFDFIRTLKEDGKVGFYEYR